MKEFEFYKDTTQDMVVDLEGIKMNMEFDNKKAIKKKSRLNRVAAAVVIGVLSVGSVGVCAYAIHKWNGGILDKYQVASEDTVKHEQTGLAQFPDENGETQSVTIDGVTISATQTIVDNYYAFVSLTVDGFEVGDGEQPGFSRIECTLDGEMVSSSSCFYDGTIDDGSGRAIMADGSEIPCDENGTLISSYMREDGTMEYHILLYTDGTKGYFIDKTLHVELTDLGVYGAKEDVQVAKEGTWAFDWKLAGDRSFKTVKLDEALGETGVVVTECEVSPISLRVVMDISDMSEKYSLEESNVPHLSGVKLKDGTLLTCITGGGSEFINNKNQCEIIFSINRMIDVDEVESFLFVKKSWSEGEKCSIDNFYDVSIVE